MGGEKNTAMDMVEEEPLSPCSRLFNSPDFNCAIIVTMGCKVKGNPPAIIDGLKHSLANHPRFSSILVSKAHMYSIYMNTNIFVTISFFLFENGFTNLEKNIFQCTQTQHSKTDIRSLV